MIVAVEVFTIGTHGQRYEKMHDCGCDLEEIILIDNGYVRWSELQYARPNERASMIPTPSGTIDGWMCPQCSRVVLYARPRKK